MEERNARRAERKEVWQERTAWLRDARVKQAAGVMCVALGGFMLLSGVSAMLTGADDIRFIQSGTEAGEGSFRNLLGALGARWAYTFMRGGFGIAAPLFGAWCLAAGVKLMAPERIPHIGRAFRNVCVAAVLLPWTVGLLTLSFDVETGLIAGWGNDHLVGAVGLWMTQWSRFALGVIGSVLVMAASYAIWAIAHPSVSAGLREFFAREEGWEEEDGEESDEALMEEEKGPLKTETASGLWDKTKPVIRGRRKEMQETKTDGTPIWTPTASPSHKMKRTPLSRRCRMPDHCQIRNPLSLWYMLQNPIQLKRSKTPRCKSPQRALLLWKWRSPLKNWH